MDTPCRVAIGVCTARRPEMLERCLAALAVQTAPDGAEITLVVADNEPEPNNRAAVAAFARACPFPVHYVHEPERGISRARNAVLDACEDRFDWIAFTDDDCQPAPDWIAALLDAVHRHRADVVYGRREWIAPASPPFWFIDQEPGRRREGQELTVAATHNVLMAGELEGLRFRQRRIGLRFDPRLAHGEDSDFFWRASTRFGARIVYSAAPVVYETIPRHRATLRYQLMRRFHYDASRFCFDRRYRSFSAAAFKCGRRLIWQLPVSVLALLIAPLLSPFSLARFKKVVVTNAGRIVGTAGAFAGLAGYNGNPIATLREHAVAVQPRVRAKGPAAGL
jgi:succinoglycan biosynthesis protein ExoM